MDRQDETLQGNEKIEVAIQALQKEAPQQQLAHTLTVIRRRMKDSVLVIVAVEPSIGTRQMYLKTLQTSDGANWWYAFTSFNEEMKGADSVKSTFLVDIDKLFEVKFDLNKENSNGLGLYIVSNLLNNYKINYKALQNEVSFVFKIEISI